MPYKGKGVYILDEQTPQTWDETLQIEQLNNYNLQAKWDDVQVVFDNVYDYTIWDDDIKHWWRTNLEFGLKPNQILEILLPILHTKIPNFQYTQHTQSFDGKLQFQNNNFWCDAKATQIEGSQSALQVGLSPNQVEHVRTHPTSSAVIRANWIGPSNGLSPNITENSKGLLVRILTSKSKVAYNTTTEYKKYLEMDESEDIPEGFTIAKKNIGANKRKYFKKPTEEQRKAYKQNAKPFLSFVTPYSKTDIKEPKWN